MLSNFCAVRHLSPGDVSQKRLCFLRATLPCRLALCRQPSLWQCLFCAAVSITHHIINETASLIHLVSWELFWSLDSSLLIGSSVALIKDIRGSSLPSAPLWFPVYYEQVWRQRKWTSFSIVFDRMNSNRVTLQFHVSLSLLPWKNVSESRWLW